MANGDAAAAAGMDTVAGTADLRNAFDEENKGRDYLAAHLTSGTHPASAITAGVFDVARIPNLPGTKITGTVPAATTAGSAASATSAYSATVANGPSGAAYARSATGTSPWYAVWMNGDNEFMRNTSSRRYKENIEDWLGSTLGLRTVIFDRLGAETPNGEVGFIAEEVLDTLPEAVIYFDDEIDGISDRVLIAALVADVQRLHAQIEQMQGGNS